MRVTDGKEYDFSLRRLKLWEKIYYPCYRFFNKITGFPRKVKWFIQRGRRGYADCDTWGMPDYLADIIPKMIKQLKKYQQGVPPEMFSNVDDRSDESWERAGGKWDKILDEMIVAFSIMNKELDAYTLTKEEIKIRNKGVKQLYKYFYNLWY